MEMFSSNDLGVIILSSEVILRKSSNSCSVKMGCLYMKGYL